MNKRIIPCFKCKFLMFENKVMYYFCGNKDSGNYGDFLGLCIDNECEGGCANGKEGEHE